MVRRPQPRHLHSNAFVSRLDQIETLIAGGDTTAAINELEALRKRADCCNGSRRERPDKNDSIVNCGDQRAVRDLIEN